jgi:hypothetical protein
MQGVGSVSSGEPKARATQGRLVLWRERAWRSGGARWLGACVTLLTLQLGFGCWATAARADAGANADENVAQAEEGPEGAEEPEEGAGEPGAAGEDLTEEFNEPPLVPPSPDPPLLVPEPSRPALGIAPRVAGGDTAPTRLLDSDGVTELSNRGDTPDEQQERALPARNDPPPPPVPADHPPEADGPRHTVEVGANSGSLVQRSARRKEKGDEDVGLGWLWYLVGVAALLLVPIGLLLNRGARGSGSVPPTSRDL